MKCTGCGTHVRVKGQDKCALCRQNPDNRLSPHCERCRQRVDILGFTWCLHCRSLPEEGRTPDQLAHWIRVGIKQGKYRHSGHMRWEAGVILREIDESTGSPQTPPAK